MPDIGARNARRGNAIPPMLMPVTPMPRIYADLPYARLLVNWRVAINAGDAFLGNGPKNGQPRGLIARALAQGDARG
jgi:hypothetical protein